MLKMIRFYTEADQGEGTRGGGGGQFFFAKLQPRGQQLFSKLQPCLILGTGLVGPQLLKDLNPPLLLPVKDVLLICILCLLYILLY